MKIIDAFRLGRGPRSTALRLAAAASVIALGGAETASAHYIGPAFLKVAGVPGSAKEPARKGWVRTEGHYWGKQPRTWFFGASILTFSAGMAPAQGPSTLALAIDKKSPEYRTLMASCTEGDALAEVTFAENSRLARNPLEAGPVPADVPDHFEYVLKNVKLACPVAEDAAQQAFVLSFEDIQLTNYRHHATPRSVADITRPADLPPGPTTGRSMVAVLGWFAGAVDANPDQCPEMNRKPPQEAFFRYLSPERAAAQRAALKASRGGVEARVMAYRAPGELNATMLPGTLKDPGFFQPKATVVPGLNLDNDDGTGKPPRGIRAHTNFTAPWGEQGIDNQMFLVEGCVEGWRRRGFLPLISNDMRASGELSILVRVSGIDDDRNDDQVMVDFLYSRDGMKRVGPAKTLLPDYTYRISDKIEDTNAFARFRGKIVDGVVVTEPVEKMSVHYSNTSALNVYKPRLRLEFKPDGSMKGILGGYRDWREYIGFAFLQKGAYENSIGFDSAGMYNAIRRAADGMQDPVTGEYLGISTAWDLEGLAAFIPPDQNPALVSVRE